MLQKLKVLALSLNGKKTYLVALAGTVLNVLVTVDPTLLTQDQLLKADAILVALGGAALRHAVTRS